MMITMPTKGQWVHAAKILVGSTPALAAALAPGFTATQVGAALIATAIAWAGEFNAHGKSGTPAPPRSSAMP